MGFDKHGIITFFVPNGDSEAAKALLRLLNQVPEIEQVSRGGPSPASTGVHSRDLNYINGQESIETQVLLKYGDDKYLEVYGIDLLAGSNISNSDSIREVVINEAFMKRLGFSDPVAAIGRLLEGSGGSYPIVGVVSDFHTEPIRKAIGPAAITNGANRPNFHVKLSGKNHSDSWTRAIKKMEHAWNQIYPDEVFDYQFYDQRIASWYQQDQQTSRLLKWITGVAILISCLGLLGLVILITNTKTKEIGIRQVLGASTVSMVVLLAKKFFKLIIVAIGISIPITWIVINGWLAKFAYAVELTWWMFALPSILLIAVAVLTIGGQVLKVAQSNPVDSLKNE